MHTNTDMRTETDIQTETEGHQYRDKYILRRTSTQSYMLRQTSTQTDMQMVIQSSSESVV